MSYGIIGISNNISGGISTNAIPQVSISGLSSIGSSGYSSIFESESKIHHGVKKYEIYESPEDVLALSITWKRLQKTNPTTSATVSNLLSSELFNHITDADREAAEEIRDYYSKKIMLWKLKNNRFSNFRNDLNTYLHNSNPRLVKNELIGMLYYLPHFYEYDSQLDNVRLEVNPVISNSIQMVSYEPRKLQPISKIVSKRKSGVTNHYWLKDVATDHAVHFVFEVSNPLEHMWAKIFAKNQPLEIEGLFYKKSRDDFEYLSVKNWNLTNI